MRSNPAHPIKDAETGEQIARYPVPGETAGHSDKEKTFASPVATFTLAIVLMEGIEEGGVDEGARPNHAGGPNNELTEHATERKP